MRISDWSSDVCSSDLLADPALDLLHCCMHRLEVQTERVQGGLHRLVVPIVRDGRAIGALQLDSDMPPTTSRPLTDGFARIYANYTALLHESERGNQDRTPAQPGRLHSRVAEGHSRLRA